MRQLIKFCIVGASSTAIDFGIFWLLRTFFPIVPWWIWQCVSFCFAVSNGFILNRRWTFRQGDVGDAAAVRLQYSKFFVTNVIGLGLTLLITKGFLILFTGQVHHDINPDTKSNLLAKLCAIPIVVIWNFSASRLWTFRAPKAEKERNAMKDTVEAPPISMP